MMTLFTYPPVVILLTMLALWTIAFVATASGEPESQEHASNNSERGHLKAA